MSRVAWVRVRRRVDGFWLVGRTLVPTCQTLSKLFKTNGLEVLEAAGVEPASENASPRDSVVAFEVDGRRRDGVVESLERCARCEPTTGSR